MGNVHDWHQVPVNGVPGSRRLTALRHALCTRLPRPHRRHRPGCGPIWLTSPLWCWRSPGYRRSGRPWWPGLPCWPARESSTSSWCWPWRWPGPRWAAWPVMPSVPGHSRMRRARGQVLPSAQGPQNATRRQRRKGQPGITVTASWMPQTSPGGSVLAGRRGCRTGRSRVQSTTAPPVKLISLAVIVRAQSDAAKAAMLATSS